MFTGTTIYLINRQSGTLDNQDPLNNINIARGVILTILNLKGFIMSLYFSKSFNTQPSRPCYDHLNQKKRSKKEEEIIALKVMAM